MWTFLGAFSTSVLSLIYRSILSCIIFRRPPFLHVTRSLVYILYLPLPMLSQALKCVVKVQGPLGLDRELEFNKL